MACIASRADTLRSPSSSRTTSSCSKADRARRAASRSSRKRSASSRTSRSSTSSTRTRTSIMPAGWRRLPQTASPSSRTRTTRPSSRRRSSAPRTLVGDNLAKSNRKPKVESAGDKRVLKDDTHTVELHHIQNLQHSDGMLVALPAQGKDSLHGGLQHPGAGAAAGSGHRDARPERRPAEARFRRTRAGARAEPRSPDDQGRPDVAGEGDTVRAR